MIMWCYRANIEMLSIKQKRSLYGFNKRKTEINGMLKGIDIEEVLKWSDAEYTSVMVYMKKCKILRNTHKRLKENNTIIDEPEPAPIDEPIDEPVIAPVIAPVVVKKSKSPPVKKSKSPSLIPVREDDETEYKIREPEKVEFTISIKKCIKKNDTLKENIKQLRKSMTPEDRPRIKKQIMALKMKLVNEYCGHGTTTEFKKLRDELTMLKYEALYGESSNLNAINIRMSWVISRLDTLTNPKEHSNVQ